MNETNKAFSAQNEKRLEILKDEKGRLLLTDDQKKAVLEKGRILVSASAGSGKTSTMVKRIILMVAEGASLKNLLILVYNNAAADELKERLHQELFRAACASSGEVRDRFRKELDEMPFCHICTIHAFCQSLIRENFDKLGLSPTFEVLDETAHETYVNKALDETIAQYAAAGDETFCDLAEIFSQSRKDDNLKNAIKKIYSLIEIQPDEKEFEKCVADCYDSYENSRFFDILGEYYSKFFMKAQSVINPLFNVLSAMQNNGKYGDSVANLISVCDRIVSADSLKKACSIARAYEKVAARIPAKASDEDKATVTYAKGVIKQIEEVLDEMANIFDNLDSFAVYHKQNGVYVRKLTEIAGTFAKKLQLLKEEDDVLSFEDLQHKAMELLSHDEYGLADAFDAVFVDEYQDVNPTQEAIIEKLVKGECFMVGDVKQSIYGFRLADPAIFISRQQKYSAFGNKDGLNVYFNHNFRSAYRILKFVNDVFDVVMTKKSADINYKSDARFELASIPPVTLDGVSPEGYVQVHLFTKSKSESESANGLYDVTKERFDDDDEDGGSAAFREGKFIANEIKTLVGRAKGVDENGNGKYIGYGDIAVLFRNRSNSAIKIVKVLKDEGIPVSEGSFVRSASLPEREIMCFMRTLDNPRQDVPFAGFLLSFFGGYDESELAKIASESGECFYDKFVACALGNDDLATKAKSTLALLEKYRLKASFESVSELMNDAVAEFCYDAYLMRTGEGNVTGLKGFIRSAAESEQSLGKFVEDYVEGANETRDGGGEDRVAISTFHGYKGLESPIVFVADCAVQFKRDSATGDLIATGKGFGDSDLENKKNNKGLVGMNYFDVDNKTKTKLTLSKLAVEKSIKDNQLKEEIRLFYVALTRAKQLMYITATVSDAKAKEFGQSAKLTGAGCALDFISQAVADGAQVPVFRHSAQDFEIDGAAQNVVAGKCNEEVKEKIAAAQAFKYPHEEATTLAMKYSVSALDSIDEETVRIYEEAAKIGTAYHKVMQYIDYFVNTESQVQAAIDDMVARNVLTEEERTVVNPKDILRCLESDVMAIAREAEKKGRCHREQSFMMYKPACEVSDGFTSQDRVLVQGVIDLFINDDVKIIVDFKNSLLRDEETVKKYKKQLYLYKSAVESVICAKIDRVVLYSFKSGKTMDL